MRPSCVLQVLGGSVAFSAWLYGLLGEGEIKAFTEGLLILPSFTLALRSTGTYLV